MSAAATADQPAIHAAHEHADAEWLTTTLARFTSEDRRRAGELLRVLSSAP